MNRLPTYLRVSVTDRCDLRCVYCRPGNDWAGRTTHTLTCGEVVNFVRAAADCGVEKVRLTGGEPLLHEDIIDIIRGVRTVGGVRSLGLTTNGQRLAFLAPALRRAGLSSVNISLPSLRTDVYRRITGGLLSAARGGFEAALNEGYRPVKVNVVLLRGINDGEIEQFARLAEHDAVEVRFIEYMPFCRIRGVPYPLVPSGEVVEKLRAMWPISAVPGGDAHTSAKRFSVAGFGGRVAVISPITSPFCRTCNRIRLTADRELRACLVDGGEVDARPFLNNGFDVRTLRRLFERTMKLKPAKHSARFCGVMTSIGG